MLRAKLLALTVVFGFLSPIAGLADNGAYTNTSGNFSTGRAVGQSITVQSASLTGTTATLSFSCPITSYGAGTYQINWTCAGGTITVTSPDGSLGFQGTFSSGSMSFSGSGGGRGGHVTYYYEFFGSFSGTVTVAGVSQSAYGSLAESVKTSSNVGSAPVTSGDFGWNSGYSPLLVGDATGSRIYRADNILGANPGTYGAPGNGINKFGTIADIAIDSASYIYVIDSLLDRLARFANLTGKGWTTFGSAGSGTGQFSNPLGVAVDAKGKIWVADSGNNRIVRFDDLTGTNWTAFGTLGPGVNQFSGPSRIAFDAQGRIYIADTGNNRLVRVDDITGTNWTTLSEVIIDPYGYLINAPSSVLISPSGRILIAAGSYLIGTDDMTGANGSAISFGGTLTGLSQDQAGTLYVIGNFTPGLAQVVNETGIGYFASPLGLPGLQASAIATRSVPRAPAAPVFSASGLAFGSQNVGEPGPLQVVSLTNLGSGLLNISSITGTPDFPVSDNCVSPLAGGASCSIGIRFDPTTTGARSGKAVLGSSNSVHANLSLPLSGTGVTPSVSIFPASLSFDPQATGTSSGAQIVTLANIGTGPLTISSITPSGDFTQTSNCPTVLTAGNSCTIQAVFKPSAAGSRAGALTIYDDAVPAGTSQSVSLQGTGSATAPAFTLAPESLFFPGQKLNTASAAQVVTLTNRSGKTVSLTSATYSTGFKGSTKCGTTLANGASCTFSIQFDPGAVGEITGTVTIPIAGKPSLSVGLSGTGVASGAPGVLVINPTSIDFGAEVIGDNYSLSVTLSNPTGTPAGIQSVSLSAPSQLTRGTNCPSVVAGGASCSVTINFTPASTPAYYDGTLTIVESSGYVTVVPIAAEGVSDNGN
jgi:hypothetical protein